MTYSLSATVFRLKNYSFLTKKTIVVLILCSRIFVEGNLNAKKEKKKALNPTKKNRAKAGLRHIQIIHVKMAPIVLILSAIRTVVVYCSVTFVEMRKHSL